jgi:alkyldihydroxyacetonephosphate synthase
VHLSHAYLDGACLYFTFAGTGSTREHGGGPGAEEGPGGVLDAESYYRRAWDALVDAVIAQDAAISHHHGIGLNRARFLAHALGDAHGVLVSLKRALDPAGILNPGKLGIPSPFGEVGWP